jgi:enamine deaminase RidA (YjgF/YER057c/UK114 family)
MDRIRLHGGESQIAKGLAVKSAVEIRALLRNGFLHIAGIAPLQGPDFAIVGKGDLQTRCSYCLDVLGRTLEAGGSSAEGLIDIVVLLTDFNGTGEIGSKYAEIAPLLAAFSGEHRPSSTAAGVSCLFTLDQRIEIRAVAKILR